MNYTIYEYSLFIALPLMLFFGFYFLLAKIPEKVIFSNYLRSRRIMGIALLLLAANYSVHFFFGIRFKNANAAILINLSTYFLCYWLFSSALTTLLDRFYITKRRLRTHFLHNETSIMHTYQSLDYIFYPFLYCIAATAERNLPDGCIADSGCLAGHLWIGSGLQTSSGL